MLRFKNLFNFLLIIIFLFIISPHKIKALSEDVIYSGGGSFKANAFLEKYRSAFKAKILGMYDYTFSHMNSPGVSFNQFGLEVHEDGSVKAYGELYPIAGKIYAIPPFPNAPVMPVGFFDKHYYFNLTGQTSGDSLSGTSQTVVVHDEHFGNPEGAPSPGRETRQHEWQASKKDDLITGTIYNITSELNLDFEVKIDSYQEIEPVEYNFENLNTDENKIQVVSDEGEEDPRWLGQVRGRPNAAYVTYNGKRSEMDNHLQLRPGMTIETEGEDGQISFSTDNAWVNVNGAGSKVQILSAQMLNQEDWDLINKDLGPNAAMIIHSGQMVIKYEAGEQKGVWLPGQNKNTGDLSSKVYVGVSNRSQNDDDEEDEEEDQGPQEPTALEWLTQEIKEAFYKSLPPESRDSAANHLLGIAFNNHSLVEYNYDDLNKEIIIKVYEGQVDLEKINFQNQESEPVANIKAGESLKINLSDFFKNNKFETSQFNLDQENKNISNLNNLILKNNLQNYLIILALPGVGLMALVIFLVIKFKK